MLNRYRSGCIILHAHRTTSLNDRYNIDSGKPQRQMYITRTYGPVIAAACFSSFRVGRDSIPFTFRNEKLKIHPKDDVTLLIIVFSPSERLCNVHSVQYSTYVYIETIADRTPSVSHSCNVRLYLLCIIFIVRNT